MGLIKGGLLRLVATTLYFLAFICSIYIMAATAWFLARFRSDFNDQNNNNPFNNGRGGNNGPFGFNGDTDFDDFFPAHNRNFAIIGMSAIATLYTSIAMLLTCCLAGIGFFAILAFLFDILFVAVMIAIAVLTRSARHGCGGDDRFRTNPFGAGIYGVGAGLFNGAGTCRIYVGTFALAIVGVFVFLAAAAVALMLFRRDRRERVVEKEKEPRRSLFKRRHRRSVEMERTSGESAREV